MTKPSAHVEKGCVYVRDHFGRDIRIYVHERLEHLRPRDPLQNRVLAALKSKSFCRIAYGRLRAASPDYTPIGLNDQINAVLAEIYRELNTVFAAHSFSASAPAAETATIRRPFLPVSQGQQEGEEVLVDVPRSYPRGAIFDLQNQAFDDMQRFCKSMYYPESGSVSRRRPNLGPYQGMDTKLASTYVQCGFHFKITCSQHAELYVAYITYADVTRLIVTAEVYYG